jgi:elongator complex protein 3
MPATPDPRRLAPLIEAIVALARDPARRATARDVGRLKRDYCRKNGIAAVPAHSELLMVATPEDFDAMRSILRVHPVRTNSGVATLAVATKPAPCPHGKCSFCPGGPGSYFGDVPQSYTGLEPSMARSAASHYEPYAVIFGRLAQYVATGHTPTKAEVIVQGGTFPALPKTYQYDFVHDCYKALNDFSRLFFCGGEWDLPAIKQFFEWPARIDDPEHWRRLLPRILEEKSNRRRPFSEEKNANEQARVRCVGLTIETKPDWGLLEHGEVLLDLGCTRVELGVQSPWDDALRVTGRGHDVETTIRSAGVLRDLGFKLNFHIMPGLPGVSRERDAAAFDRYFSDAAFRPDMLKVYPCMVMPGTLLHDQWIRGAFAPLSTAEAAERIVDLKEKIPPWCRLMRVQRDIPSPAVAAGVEHNNLRQEVDRVRAARGVVCRCIRCREPQGASPAGSVEMSSIEYEASGGMERFLEAGCGDRILGFLRLRFPGRTLRRELDCETAVVREMHVYGTAADFGRAGDVQHGGIGGELLKMAEGAARKGGRRRIAVIAAVGARGYFRKRGYGLEGPYMVKAL